MGYDQHPHAKGGKRNTQGKMSGTGNSSSQGTFLDTVAKFTGFAKTVQDTRKNQRGQR